jgi:hypothetical protein
VRREGAATAESGAREGANRAQRSAGAKRKKEDDSAEQRNQRNQRNQRKRRYKVGAKNGKNDGNGRWVAGAAEERTQAPKRSHSQHQRRDQKILPEALASSCWLRWVFGISWAVDAQG